jgi:death-on-curing protein
MIEPIWVSEELALRIHDYQLAKHGGLSGLRNRDGFLSALDRPKNRFVYGETELVVLAANYAFGLATNHPFVDGNKRTAMTACLVFLRLNGWTLKSDRADQYRMFHGLGAGIVTEDDLIEWLRTRVIRIGQAG